MSREQLNFFIGDFAPYKYFSGLAPFALAIVADHPHVEPTPTVRQKLVDLLSFAEKLDERRHNYALSNFYEYQQLWTGMNFFIEYITLSYFAGLSSPSDDGKDRLSYLKEQAKNYLHNFLLSQKPE